MKTLYQKFLSAMEKYIQVDLDTFHIVGESHLEGEAEFQGEKFTVIVCTDEYGSPVNAMATITAQIVKELDNRLSSTPGGYAKVAEIKEYGPLCTSIPDVYYTRKLCWAAVKYIQDNMSIKTDSITRVGDDSLRAIVTYDGQVYTVSIVNTAPERDQYNEDELADLFAEQFAQKVLAYVDETAYGIVSEGALTWLEESIVWKQFYLELVNDNMEDSNREWLSLGLNLKSTRELNNENARWVLDILNMENPKLLKEIPLVGIYRDVCQEKEYRFEVSFCEGKYFGEYATTASNVGEAEDKVLAYFSERLSMVFPGYDIPITVRRIG